MAQTESNRLGPAAGRDLRHFRALVQIDTTNPPGNETKAVDYLKKVLEDEGIPTQTFALDPNRTNLVARLKGNGSKRPLLIMAHTDIVGVQRRKWPVDPFGAVLKDGYVWGRGTTDDKDKLSCDFDVDAADQTPGAVLDRDLIFLAESGEEADPTGVWTSAFMVDKHFERDRRRVCPQRRPRRDHGERTSLNSADYDHRKDSAQGTASSERYFRPRFDSTPG